jgi:hypothetical protein
LLDRPLPLPELARLYDWPLPLPLPLPETTTLLD